ncbi:chloride channel protein, partial [Streptomyces murinus]
MSAIPAALDSKHPTGDRASGPAPAPRLKGLRNASWTVMALAVVVGAGAGVGSIVFRWCIQTFTRLLSGHSDYAASPGAANPHVPWLGPYFVLLAPVVGGLLYGPLVNR